MTTNDDSTGANAGQKNRLCACSTPYASTVAPYMGTCTANTRRKNWMSSAVAAPDRPARTLAIGPDASASTRPSGASTASVQPSAADATCSTSRRSPREIGPASNGTIAPASAPPAATSNSTLGSTLAPLYASAITPAPRPDACAR